MRKVLFAVAALLLLASCSGSDPVSVCGDGLVTGSEECDGGVGCGNNCRLIGPGDPTDPTR